MADHVVVITGAGASFDCTRTPPFDEGSRPPLTTDLFHPRFAALLDVYPLVQSIAPDIRVAVQGGAVGLEAFLRDELRDSAAAYDRRRFRGIPLYLQHLLFEVGRRFTRLPDNYDRLVNAALRHQEALFVTLNYDTILDERLAIHSPADSIDAYIDPGNRGWSLIKLHGSVDWAREVLNEEAREIPGGDRLRWDVFDRLGEAINLHPRIARRVAGGGDLISLRYQHPGAYFYPAVSVPLGPEDEINCPPEHVEFLKARLANYDSLNLVVIGYSGLDREVIELLRTSGKRLRSLLVVSENGDRAFETARVLCEATQSDLHESMAYADDFARFAQTSAITDYMRALP